MKTIQVNGKVRKLNPVFRTVVGILAVPAMGILLVAMGIMLVAVAVMIVAAIIFAPAMGVMLLFSKATDEPLDKEHDIHF